MAKMKTSTLVKKMMENPEAVAAFLDTLSDETFARLFPNHTITTKMKTVRNLMTGKYVVIPANTPRICDPSSELYWST